MDDSIPSNLQVWKGGIAAVIPEPTPGTAANLLRPPTSLNAADSLFASEALLPPTMTARSLPAAAAYSLQWFLEIENQRYGRNARWIPRSLEFAKHAGERLLGVGNGLGTDWVQYARHGASVAVCCPSSEQLALVRRNFELRGLTGSFLHAPPIALPVESASVDVVCLGSLLRAGVDAGAVISEVYRVLKPGGKVLAVVPARYDVGFWFHVCFPWQRWLGLRRPPLSAPLAKYSGRRLRRLLGRFIEHRVSKRHLRRCDVPHVWRWLPRSLLERVMGQVLVAKAFKPLSAAIPLQAAA